MLVYKGLNTSVKAGMLIILLLTSASYADNQGESNPERKVNINDQKKHFSDQKQPVLTV